MTGRFLSFEGPDKAGKSTQIQLFAQHLQAKGIPFLLTREPGGCPVSEKKIRDLILAPENEMGDLCEALLYAASRSELVRTVIRPAGARHLGHLRPLCGQLHCVSGLRTRPGRRNHSPHQRPGHRLFKAGSFLLFSHRSRYGHAAHCRRTGSYRAGRRRLSS